MTDQDRYEGLDYRTMIQWSARLQREWPLFEAVFAEVPAQRLLDLGCGPGEHCARFAAAGWRTTGVDVSAAQIADARSHHPDLDFVECDLGRMSGALDGEYGAALCVGNVGPNLDDAAFEGMLAELARRLPTGALFLYQQLEFGPILAGQRRSIGPMFRALGDHESVFLRIFRPCGDDRSVDFFPTRFELDPDADPPVTLERVQRVRWRARRRQEVEEAFAGHGFEVTGVWGSPEREPHDPASSNDLWVLARR